MISTTSPARTPKQSASPVSDAFGWFLAMSWTRSFSGWRSSSFRHWGWHSSRCSRNCGRRASPKRACSISSRRQLARSRAARRSTPSDDWPSASTRRTCASSSLSTISSQRKTPARRSPGGWTCNGPRHWPSRSKPSFPLAGQPAHVATHQSARTATSAHTTTDTSR